MPQLDQTFLDTVFPADRADAFFEALYDGTEEGAFDIRLVCRSLTENSAELAFELHERPGKCLRCNLTYGLPQVFQRLPRINLPAVVTAICGHLGWPQESRWQLGRTEEMSDSLHVIPLHITRA